jgi:hypothetical protein
MIKKDLINYIFKPHTNGIEFDIRNVPELSDFIIKNIIKEYKREKPDGGWIYVNHLTLDYKAKLWFNFLKGSYVIKDINTFGVLDCDRCEFAQQNCTQCFKYVNFNFSIYLIPLDIIMGIGYPMLENGWTRERINSIDKEPKISLEIK